jgi:glycopeptide antibiotics resistance protein
MGGGRRRPWKPATILRLVAVGYALALVAITMLPIRFDPWRVDYPNDDYRPQLRPLRGSGTTFFQSSHPLHMLGEQIGNVLLFAPFGFLLPLLRPELNGPWRLMALGAGTSVGIELMQVAMPGIHRADINDVLLNTLGVGLGWLTLRLTRRAAAHRQATSDEWRIFPWRTSNEEPGGSSPPSSDAMRWSWIGRRHRRRKDRRWARSWSPEQISNTEGSGPGDGARSSSPRRS